MTPLVSIVLAAHKEGLIAHKTMLSIERATKKLKEENLPFDIIVTVDSGDKYTAKYFERYADSPNISVLPVQFGDLAMSRNYGISKASGRYIATLDADDLVSENWFVAGVNMLRKQNKPTILHTQYSINFGTQNIIWEKFDSRTKEEDAVIMTWANRWDSAVIAAREVFERFPYEPNRDGYGSEDWHFNSQTLAAGIAHKVVPETTLFVRRKDTSLMTQQSSSRSTVRYTDLLDFDFLRTVNHSSFNDTKEVKSGLSSMFRLGIKTRLREIHRAAKHRSILYSKISNRAIKAFRPTAKHDHLESNRFPKWLLQEWRDIHAIEKELFPDKDLVNNITLYRSEMYEIGKILCEIAKSTTRPVDYCIFVPHLTSGGAELVALRYVDTIKNLHPDWNVAVVATEYGDNIWVDRLPEDVSFINFGELTHHLSEDLREHLMARFLVQSKVSRIHIAQSTLMFRFARQHKTLLSNKTVYSFAFCEDKDAHGRVAGHIHTGLPYAYDSINSIFTDNRAVVKQLVNEYGFDDTRFQVHYQPSDHKLIPPKDTIDPENVRVLWASRIAKQKRPDVLVEIARQLPASIHIDVFGSFQDGYDEDVFEGVGSVSYMGPFNGLSSIPTSEYDIFLYTSENDGVPNVLLEATSLGLPIVASDSGGVGEFITNTTGRLVNNYTSASAYIDALNEITESPDLRIQLVTSAQELLSSQHSHKQFVAAIKADIV